MVQLFSLMKKFCTVFYFVSSLSQTLANPALAHGYYPHFISPESIENIAFSGVFRRYNLANSRKSTAFEKKEG